MPVVATPAQIQKIRDSIAKELDDSLVNGIRPYLALLDLYQRLADIEASNYGPPGGSGTTVDLTGIQTSLDNILAEMRDDVFINTEIWEDRSTTVSVFYRVEWSKNQGDQSITTTITRLSDNVVVTTLPSGATFVSGANDALLTRIGDQSDTAATSDTGTFSWFAFIKRGLQNWTTLLNRTPASLGAKTAANSFSTTLATDDTQLTAVLNRLPTLASGRLPVESKPAIYTLPGTGTVSTPAAGGSAYQALSPFACNQVEIINLTGTTIQILRAGNTVPLPLPTSNSKVVRGITNTSEISVQRLDGSTTSVTLSWEAFTV